jgi:cytochrome o ubiquinol oxidase operon protein cyoD
MTHTRKLISYAVGFLSSIGLTLFAFWVVTYHILTGWSAAWVILSLALVQCAVQLFFFLHIGDDTRPRWKFLSMLFMLAILVIIVVGSLWIMDSLNGRMMMSPEQMTKYMDAQAGL